LRSLISDKNIFGAEELLTGRGVAQSYCKMLLKVSEHFGSVEVLNEAKGLVNNPRSLEAVRRLENLYRVLQSYGVAKYVSFDLGMLSKYNYYTGIIFKAYTYGVGEPVVKGGRYDRLLGYFGKKAPAVGFAIVVDDLMSALERQKACAYEEDEIRVLTYHASDYEEKLLEARKLRAKGIRTVLRPDL
ncbi:MAG: ATP phosphoribosyltransferase regulatory subunit, partial [Lachnospiraceae bacterium]|nr:ATP phosphoribosyltransferase regulatory subunit [Lachnospiraceae bacterium]